MFLVKKIKCFQFEQQNNQTLDSIPEISGKANLFITDYRTEVTPQPLQLKRQHSVEYIMRDLTHANKGVRKTFAMMDRQMIQNLESSYRIYPFGVVFHQFLARQLGALPERFIVLIGLVDNKHLVGVYEGDAFQFVSIHELKPDQFRTEIMSYVTTYFQGMDAEDIMVYSDDDLGIELPMECKAEDKIGYYSLYAFFNGFKSEYIQFSTVDMLEVRRERQRTLKSVLGVAIACLILVSVFIWRTHETEVGRKIRQDIEASEERFELINSKVVDLSREKVGHNLAKTRPYFGALLNSTLDLNAAGIKYVRAVIGSGSIGLTFRADKRKDQIEIERLVKETLGADVIVSVVKKTDYLEIRAFKIYRHGWAS